MLIVVAVLHFIFVLHFVVAILHFIASYVMLIFSLLFNFIPHPSVDYRWVFTPILYFQPSPSQSDSRHFHFQPFRYLFAASTTVLSRHYLPPTGVFYLTLLHRHFTCVYQYQGLPGSRQFFLEIGRALHWSSNTGQAYLFVWFTVIHNLHTQNDSFLNSTINYHELLVVKV